MSAPFTIKLPPGVLEEGVLRIDNTRYGPIAECQRKGWNVNAWNRILPGWEPSKGFGSAIHSAQDVRFQGWGSGPYGKECMRAMERALRESFTERVKCPDCTTGEFSDGPCLTCQGTQLVSRQIESHEGDHRTLGRAIEVMAEYDKLHPTEEFEVLASELKGEKELGVVDWTETRPEFQVPHRCKVIWQYRIDRVIRDRRDGHVAVMDTKTTASSSVSLEQVRNEFKMSPQFKLYCWAVSKMGLPDDTKLPDVAQVRDAVIDHMVVRKPLLRPSPSSPPRNELNRLPLRWTWEQIEECRRDTLSVIGQWLSACGRWGVAPPMSGAPRNCHKFKSPCPYLQCCEQESERDRIAWLLGGNYVDNEWVAFEPEKEEAAV